MQKTFLLGVGCEKGGTTWVNSYLKGHPQCAAGFAKEYHIFDAAFIPEFEGHKNRVMRQLRDSLGSDADQGGLDDGETQIDEKPKVAGKNKFVNLLRLAQFYDDDTAYAEYFLSLAHKKPDTRLVWDITPSYSSLKPRHLRHVKKLMERHGFDVKVMFLMRDPVERIYSSARHQLQMRKTQDPDGQKAIEITDGGYRRRIVQMRTRYERTVSNIERVFAPAQVHLQLYETLFTEDSVRGLTDSLGLDPHPADFDRRVNATVKRANLPEDVRQKVKKFYSATYAFAQDRFGADTVAAVWG